MSHSLLRARWVKRAKVLAEEVISIAATMKHRDLFTRNTTRRLALAILKLLQWVDQRDKIWQTRLAEIRRENRKLRRDIVRAQLKYTEKNSQLRDVLEKTSL